MVLSLISGILGANSAKKSAAIQAQATDRAADKALQGTRESNAMLERFRKDDIARFQPYAQSGQNALAGFNFEMGLGERPEGYQGFTATPGYDFRMQQGMDAVQGSVAARQGLLSGAALKGVQQFGQNLGSQEYGNYLARLGGMVDSGQNAAGLQAGSNAGYGGAMAGNTMAGANTASNMAMQRGNAQAAGVVGGFNALSSGIGQAVGGWQSQNMLNAFAPRPEGAAPYQAPAGSKWIF